jgi:hypothetical protein
VHSAPFKRLKIDRRRTPWCQKKKIRIRIAARERRRATAAAAREKTYLLQASRSGVVEQDNIALKRAAGHIVRGIDYEVAANVSAFSGMRRHAPA